MKKDPSVSIIVPVRNESQQTLHQVQELILVDDTREIIIVDASDRISTVNSLRQLSEMEERIHLIHSDRVGRAVQMNLGSKQASGDILWFVHADTTVPGNSIKKIQQELANHHWGRFDVNFNNSTHWMKLVAWAMNFRSSLSDVCTGDQAIFVNRELFELVGGYPELEIMEDIALSKILRKKHSARRIRTPVITSARRWEQNGYCRTIGKMWLMRLLYYFGVSPATLAKMYRQAV